MEIVKVCKKHGELTLDQVYKNNDKNLKNGFCYKCKLCVYEAQSNRPCKTHGELGPDDRTASGKCRACSFIHLQTANEKRNNNRDWWNEREALKRAANPEIYAEIYKKRYQRKLEIHGSEYLNQVERTRRVGITIEELRRLTGEQDNKCAICFNPETRIASSAKKIAALCIDHCHETGKVRGLLCHDCNTSIGKMKDDIQRLQSAIDYLKKHKHVD